MRMPNPTEQRPIWAALMVPSAVCGVALAPAAGWVGGSWAAATVFAACLLNAILISRIVERFQRDASAQLRRPELRGQNGYQSGWFGPLLSEALLHIEELEQRAASMAEAKNELEARVHVVRRRQRHFAGSLDILEDPVLLTDTTGHVVHANPAAQGLWRADQAKCHADQTDRWDLGSVPQIADVVRQVLERPVAGARSADFAIDGGDAVTHRAIAWPVFDDEGQVLGTAVHVADVRHECEENQQQAEFVSSVCHELKTPMSSIRAFTELLRDGEFASDEERVELCGFIESQVDRLTRLINNMLNLARIQSGMIKVQREDCELNDVLEPAVETVAQLADAKGVKLVAELSELYLAVHVDKDLLGQAVINLLSNAIKYTPAEGEVRLRSRLDDDRAVIEVKDTGMGIPQESLPRLFERFYRVPRNTAAAPGTGLGLALVKYITADLHNGSITVQSEVDKGSAFVVSLPFGHRDKLQRREPATRTVETT